MFTQFLNLAKGDYLDSKLKGQLGEYYGCLQSLQHLQDEDRIQARLPFEMIVK
jgi:hypothetical protein